LKNIRLFDNQFIITDVRKVQCYCQMSTSVMRYHY